METEHVLLGLLRDSEGVAARVLGELPSTLSAFVEQLV
jgi:hypothetical protein